VNDLHNNIRTKTAIKAVAMTTIAGITGKIIDRQGYGGVEFIFSYGEITATDAVFTIGLKEGSVTGTLTSVADSDLLGTELLAGLAAQTRTSGTGKNVTKRIGYVGSKRYVQANLISSTVTATTKVAAIAVLHNPTLAPTTNP
jgi:hypothetical protein